MILLQLCLNLPPLTLQPLQKLLHFLIRHLPKPNPQTLQNPPIIGLLNIQTKLLIELPQIGSLLGFEKFAFGFEFGQLGFEAGWVEVYAEGIEAGAQLGDLELFGEDGGLEMLAGGGGRGGELFCEVVDAGGEVFFGD